MHLFDGITARTIETPDLLVNVLERTHDDASAAPGSTIVLLHDLLSSALTWQELMQDLPSELRVLALDLRGFGGTESAPVDAARGLGQFVEDLHGALTALDAVGAHLVGWGLGGAVAMAYALDHPVPSLTLEAPLSPYGLGGTRLDGARLHDDDRGCGAGIAHPELVRRLTEKDEGTDSAFSPRAVFRAEFVAESYRSEHEDVWVEAMLSTSTATGNYPGDLTEVAPWPGFAPGATGVLNALAPGRLNLSGLTAIPRKPPVLWVHGTDDVLVSDRSLLDPNALGALGLREDWPGEDTAPPQPMVAQLRDVLGAYADAGGDVTELTLIGAGHSPHLERPAEFRRALLRVIGYIGLPHDPAPPTETIVLRSAD